MLLGLLLTLNILVCLALIGVVLLQRSEGGALGGGGSPTGLVTTRGAGDLLTRTTWVLFTLFLALSLALTLLGGRERSSQAIIDRLKLQSINPDALATHPPPPAAAAGGGAAPGAVPASAPAAPKPTIRSPGAAPAGPTAPAGSQAFSAPTPVVSLPPLSTPAPTSAPAPVPAKTAPP